MVEILIWVCFLILAGAASVAQTVAASVHELRTAVLAANSPRVRRVNDLSGGVGAAALAGAAAWSVNVIVRAGGDGWLAGASAGISTLALLGAQWLARKIALANLEQLAAPLLGNAIVFLPLADSRNEPSEPEEQREETLEQMVDAGAKAGLIESSEREMISGVIGLDRTLTREVMVPRMDVIALDVETPFRDALNVIVADGHSRVPVYAETIDHVVGIVYAKDLLKVLRDGKPEGTLRDVMRAAHFVPETKRLDELLAELQAVKVHLAIVVDEYGGTAGIVTIEDVIEEIVGEIQDEYDNGEEALIERVSDTEGVFNARVSISDVNETLALELPGESDTLGGLVYQRLQKMPKVGDQVQVNEATIVVLSVVGRRIKQVRVTKPTSGNSLSVTREDDSVSI